MDRGFEILVALGGMFLFLSLAAMAVVEGISSLFDMRAKEFEKGVTALLEDRATDVLNSPLLRSLGRASGRKKDLPSYVPPEIFATAVMGLMKATKEARELAMAAEASAPPALVEMADEVGADTAALKSKIEAWFEAGMERVSGRYRRSIQWVTRVVALALVFGLNADSFEVGARAWSDPSVRQEALEYSQKLLEMCKRDDVGKLSCPGVPESGAEAAAAYPLGWTSLKWHAMKDVGGYLYKLIGLLTTVLAATLGAPFWFDVLTRLAPGLRQAGPKPGAISRT